MGKRIRSQRRGRSPRYGTKGHKYKTKNSYVSRRKNDVMYGKVLDLINCPGRSSPLVSVEYEGGDIGFMVATDKVAVGDLVALGVSAPVQEGNVLPLGNLPEGTFVCNIESVPGDGGKFVRSSGVFAKIVSRSDNKVSVLLPSKKQKVFDANCLASVGVVAGGGRLEKPFVKAGKRWRAKRARGKLYPITSAVAMNAVNHPYGSGRGRHAGKVTIAPKHAPPGRKVGKISPRRTGKRK